MVINFGFDYTKISNIILPSIYYDTNCTTVPAKNWEDKSARRECPQYKQKADLNYRFADFFITIELKVISDLKNTLYAVSLIRKVELAIVSVLLSIEKTISLRLQTKLG